ncbi:MAG: hypothetical protein ABSF44_08920 [Candidatus Bathyarchaeia archaeon]
MRKGDRIVAEHIFSILEEYKGTGKRFRDIKFEMAKRGWMHCDDAIVHNYTWLIRQGRIIKVEHYYGVPVVREDGTAFIETSEPNKPVEVWKVKPNA